MTIEEYHKDPAISSSHFKYMKVMAKYKAWLDGRYQDNIETKSMLLGSMYHTYVLERESFDDRYVVVPDLTKGILDSKGNPYKEPTRTNEYKRRLDEFKVQNDGRVLVDDPGMITTIKYMAESTFRHPVARELLRDFEAEKSFFWFEPLDYDTDVSRCDFCGRKNFSSGAIDCDCGNTYLTTAIRCKARPDALSSYVIDIKTTDDADPVRFTEDKVYGGFRYIIQAALQVSGVESAGYTVDKYYYLVIERTPPYLVSVIDIPLKKISEWREVYKSYLLQIRQCRDTDIWPGYDEIYVGD